MKIHDRLLVSLPLLLTFAASARAEAASSRDEGTSVDVAPATVADVIEEDSRDGAFDLDAAAAKLKDGPLSDSRARLLAFADKAASALPLDPHVKNRSRAQLDVAQLCIELDQPRRAFELIGRIENWRRGLGYADLSFFCAKAGLHAEAMGFAALALEIAEAGDETEQGWRKDRILVRVAQTQAISGNRDEASELQEGVVSSELGKVETAKASVSDVDEFDSHLEVVQLIATSSDFEQIRNAMETCSQLYDRYYDDAERRQRAEGKIKEHWGGLPLTIRIQLAIDLADHAVRHGDKKNGLRLVNEGQEIFESVPWTPEDFVSLSAGLAKARFQCGDEHAAFEQANGALAHYQAKSEEIVDIFRPDCLRPLARAFAAIGDHESTALVYRMALEEGVHNPNSRPRAMDVTATCLSMVTHDFQPQEETWKRIDEIVAALGPPW